MQTQGRSTWAAVTAWSLLAALVSAQITFSRDWTGGKRAAPQLGVDCAQFSRVCRHFVHELRHAVSAQIGEKVHKPPDEVDDAPLSYDDDEK